MEKKKVETRTIGIGIAEIPTGIEMVEIERFAYINKQRPEVYKDVADERRAQDHIWGEQNHVPADWLMVLGEEVGEANAAALEAKFANMPEMAKKPGSRTYKDLREELIQVAAVAVAMIESLDRNELSNEETGMLKATVDKSRFFVEPISLDHSDHEIGLAEDETLNDTLKKWVCAWCGCDINTFDMPVCPECIKRGVE